MGPQVIRPISGLKVCSQCEDLRSGLWEVMRHEGGALVSGISALYYERGPRNSLPLPCEDRTKGG